LSKRVLLEAGEVPRSFIHSEEFYREQRIELRLDTRVGAVDTSKQTVTTAAGEQIGYGRLLIATGAAPKTLAIPGMTLAGTPSA
jgi:NAD(P)H-nitrite reductase large subunit